VDTFAKDRLPPKELWPRLHFDLPELQYPARLNCATVLLDDAIPEGHGDRPAILTDAGPITYTELLERANRIANVLKGAGVVPGNRVLLRGYNGPELYAAWLAVMKTGAIAVTTMPMLRAPELAAIIVKAEPAIALSDHRLLMELRTAISAQGFVKTVISWGGGDLEGRMERASDEFVNANTAADDVCLLAFTSGTTGQPKACAHFHRDVLAMADVVGRHLLQTRPGDIYAGSPPLGFTFGLGALLVFPLRFRAATVPIEAPAPATILAAIEKYRITCLFTAPFAYRALAGELAGRDISSLQRCVSAGEFLPKSVSDTWHEKTGIRIIDGIGATEMIHIFISASGADIRPGATGKPLPGYRACVLDEACQPMPPGSTGYLAVTGPTGCRYLADERQRDYVVAGWNVTGDLTAFEGACPQGYEILRAHETRQFYGPDAYNQPVVTSEAVARCRKPGESTAEATSSGSGGAALKAGSSPCVPGATQTCVGPGACRGGQQCLADGAAFGPCDCGAPAPAAPTSPAQAPDAGVTAPQQ
jgi:2-aminobenzoate-CoA ligase